MSGAAPIRRRDRAAMSERRWRDGFTEIPCDAVCDSVCDAICDAAYDPGKDRWIDADDFMMFHYKVSFNY